MLVALPALAHHSLTAEFDVDRPVTIHGTIARVEWMNPHAWIYVNSGTERWSFEVGAPSELIRRGWSRADLKIGDEITIDIDARRLDVDLTDDEIARRVEAYEPPEPRYRRGVMAKYAASVSSASEGAVTS